MDTQEEVPGSSRALSPASTNLRKKQAFRKSAFELSLHIYMTELSKDGSSSVRKTNRNKGLKRSLP